MDSNSFNNCLFYFLCKQNFNSLTLFVYFMVQELLGLYFLLFNFIDLQILIILFKIGTAPFHFWVFIFLLDINKYIFFWFITYQKIPYILILFFFFTFYLFYLLFIGLLFCLIQVFLLKSNKSLLFIISSESFNWFLFYIMFFFMGFFVLFLFYVFFLGLALYMLNFEGWLIVLFFINIPLTFIFLVKILVLFVVNIVGFLVLLFLFLIFLTILSARFLIVKKSLFYLNLLDYKIYYYLFIWQLFIIV